MNKISIFVIIFLVLFEITNSQTPTKRVLLEEFSTAPCGFCPEGGIIAEGLLGKYPELITYTHHAGFGVDSMTINESKIIAKKFTNFAPSAVIDRNYHSIPVYTYPEYLAISRQKWDSIAAIHLNEVPEAEISITSHNYLTSLNSYRLNFSVKFLKDFPNDDYRINVAIVEDSVSGTGSGWDQKNYFNDNPNYPTLYKKGDPIVGYVHRHVIRAMPYGAWGSREDMPAEIKANYIHNFILEVNNIPDAVNMEHCRVVLFLSKYNDNNQLHKIYNSVEDEIPIDFLDVKENESNMLNLSKVYPNPVRDLAYLNTNFVNPTYAQIELYSSLGIKIRDIDNGVYQDKNVYFYASDLPAGVYFIKIASDRETRFVSFVVE